MHFDGTVTLGNLLSALAMVLAVYGAYSRLRERLITIETRLDPLWAEFTDRRTTTRRAEDRE